MSKKRKADSDRPESGSAASKRRKSYTTSDFELAQLYEKISNHVGESRANAVKELSARCIKALRERSDGQQPALVDLSVPKNLYVRLIRGCCSGSKSTNDGFSVALTACLWESRTNSELQDHVLGLIEKHTTPGLDATRPEKRHHLYGRLSAYGAVLRSGTFSQDPKIPDPRYIQSLDAMAKLCVDHRLFLERYSLCMQDVIMDLQAAETSPIYVQSLIQCLCTHNLARSPEGIATWITVTKEFPKAKLPKDIWHHRNPFSKKDFSAVVNIMKLDHDPDAVHDSEGLVTDRTGAKQLTPNGAWDIVLEHLADLCKPEYPSKADRANADSLYARFWTEAVDKYFFADNASTDRKSLGFQILLSQLSSTPSWVLGIILSPNLLRCLINQSAHADRSLHKVAKGVLRAVLERANRRHDSAAVIVQSLMFRAGGSIDFDKLTSKSGVKTVHTILSKANDAALIEIVDVFYVELEAMQTKDAQDADTKRQVIADVLLNTVRSRLSSLPTLDASDALHPLDMNVTWPSRVLIDLAKYSCRTYAHLPLSKRPSDKTLELMKSRLASALGQLLGTARKGVDIILIDVLDGLNYADFSDLQVIKDSNEAIRSTIQRAVTRLTLRKLELSRSLPRAFSLLLSITLLQAYMGDIEAIPLLDELCDHWDNLHSQDKTDGASSDAMIELLLSFAAKQSVLHRKLTEQVFGIFASGMSYHALQSMLDVLQQRENATGQKALFEPEQGDDEDAGMADGVSSEATDEQDSDVEHVVVGADENDADDDDNASDTSDSGSANSADERLDAALADMLGTKISKTDSSAPNGTNTDAGDPADDTDSDESMDDEQMLALEPHLAAAFRARTNATSTLAISEADASRKGKQTPSASEQRKKDSSAAKSNMLNFKNRVLDLLGIWLKQDPSNGLTLQVVLPLLELIRTTSSKQIAEKTAVLLKTYFDAAKGKGMPTVLVVDQEEIDERVKDEQSVFNGPRDQQMLYLMLKDIHEEALRFASKLHAGVCSRASLFLARCLLDQSTRKSTIDAANTDTTVPPSTNPSPLPAPTTETTRGRKHKKRDKDKTKAATTVSDPKPQPSLEVQDKINNIWTVLIQLYASTQQQRRVRKSGLPAAFLRDFVDWEISMGW